MYEYRLAGGENGSLYVPRERGEFTDFPARRIDMKVSELIQLLEEQDPEAEVLVMSQQNWPFENACYGVTTRADMLGGEDDDDERPLPDGGAMSDVFIVEGSQLRYGSRAAWDTAAR